MSNFKRGTEFPNEGFVQSAIEDYFASLGFVAQPHPPTDYIGIHEGLGEKWAIEAKGKTMAIGTDFHTGIGQLVKRMDDPTTKYGLAFPDIPQFQKQTSQVKNWVREALGLHWILVKKNGAVEIILPTQKL